MSGERETMQSKRLAIRQRRLKEPMRGADLNKALGISWGGNFLAKHCLGTGSSTARFVRVSHGLYRLRESDCPVEIPGEPLSATILRERR